MKLMNYKGYYGSIEASTEDNCLYGKLEFIEPLVNYQAQTVAALKKAFQTAVDDYLETCKSQGWEPEKPYKGSFNVRIGQELHRKVIVEARQRNLNLNEFVKQAIEHELSGYGG